jgi:carboxypeptidase T
MKSTRLALAILYIFFFSIYAQAQEKWSKVKIFVTANKTARAELVGLLQIDHFDTDENGAVVTEISESALASLKALNYPFQVLVPDVARHLDSLNQIYYTSLNKKDKNNVLGRVAIEQPGSTLDKIIPKPAAFQVKSTFGGYYRFTEMEAAMNTLVSTYPSIASKTSIGKTYGGRDIWVIKISDNVATDEANEPEVLYLGLQHAREAITGASMIFFMQYLCEQYASDNRIRDLVNNREFFIIPCFNPDGWEYNYTLNSNGGGGWRKNRSPVDSTTSTRTVGTGQNKTTITEVQYTAFGVDLNRNWGVDWANCSTPINGPSSSCGSGTNTAETYWGPSAFSEKETQAVREFTKSHHIVAGFDQHAFGPYYSLPFGRQSLHKNEMPQKGKDFFNTIPALMGKYNGMRAADSYDALSYEVAGGFKDWMLMGEVGSILGTGKKDTVWAMTGEGGAGGGTGGSYGSFWAPAGQIVNLCKGMTYQNLQLAYAAGTYVDIQDASDIAMNTTSGSLPFRVKRLGLGNDAVKVTLVPLENMASGGSFTIPGMAYYEDYNGSINYNLSQSVSNGQRIKFAWKVETGGYSYADTIVKFFKPLSLMSDDMEGSSISSAWTVSGGWNYSTDDKFGGSKSLAESPGGNYTTSTTRIATNNNVLNLNGVSSAYLTFWTKYRAENFRDKLQVQISTNSTDGVNGTWTAIPGKYTIQEPGTLDGSTIDGKPSLTGIRDYWSQEVFDLTSYNKSAALRFRFVFTSDGDPTGFKYEVDDGFYIDNLKVIKTEANLVTLPVNFLKFYGNLFQGNTVQLNWEAQTDELHDYFEIERSHDGNRFISLGKSVKYEPYQFIDKLPKPGNNYYRIKQFDKDGKTAYSKVINIFIERPFHLTIFPNPVRDQLTISLNSSQTDLFKVQITDVQGKVVYDRIERGAATSTELQVDTKTWKPQVYILRITNSRNELLTTQKVIKL